MQQLMAMKTRTVALLLILMGFQADVGQSSPSGTAGCLASQFRCVSSGRCVNLNLFCDGRKDCEDNSDEPTHCTHCNRTYYAGTGESYRLLINWPKPNQMPFTCFLTFTSATHDPSEFLQVRMDTATIGQYLLVQNHESSSSSRCPDGCMQIWEGDQPAWPSLQQQASKMASGLAGRQSQAGGWCGATITPRFYYTDSTSVTFGLRLLSIPASLQSKLVGSNLPQQHPVLDLTYRVLPRSSAIVRYGSRSMDGNKYHLGELMAGTICSRSFRQCGANDSVQCRIQSPGYPGIYPRHAHCLYRISHRPNQATGSSSSAFGPAAGSGAGRRHVVVLWQNDGRKINLRDWDQPVEQQQQQQQHQQQQKTRSASECESSGDYISVYDGTTTSAPVLARFCDGPLPEVVSSGPDVLVEFRSSPLDTIFAASTAIEGFELKVRIAAVEPASSSSSLLSSSTTTVGDALKCRWNVTSSGLSRGWLGSPQQTWPLGTTCQFRFLGRPDERVWIYFAKYHFVGTPIRSSRPASSEQQCRNVLRIADGDASDWDPSLAVVNGSVVRVAPPARTTIGLFCRDRPPPLCERQLLVFPGNLSSGGGDGQDGNSQNKRAPPPCLAGESFISKGATLTVQQYLPDGTAFTFWKYVLAYEFFRETLDGRALFNSSAQVVPTSRPANRLAKNSALPYYDCNRIFSVDVETRGNVKSPQNVFLFGRGGARQLGCVYRFQGEETMRVAIEVTRLRLGGRQCKSEVDPLTHQRRCNSGSTDDDAHHFKGKSVKSGWSSPAFLQLRERPWGQGTGQAGHNVLLERDCLCETGLLPFRYVSTGSTVEVVFQVEDMSHADDYHDFFFEISYEFLSGMKCASQSELRPLQGPGGLITLDGLRGHAVTSSPNSCNRQSWFLLPRPDRFLFLSTTNGFIMNGADHVDDCRTKNRILIYASQSQHQGRPMAIICPSLRSDSGLDGGGVKIFTPVFAGGSDHQHRHPADVEKDDDDKWAGRNESSVVTTTGGVVIEFIAIQSGSYQLKWLELTPQAVFNPAGSVVPLGSVSSPPHPSSFCSTWCPELKACVDSQLWCDGVYDCPSGVDEMDQQCQSAAGTHPGRSWSIPKVYWYLMAAGSTLLALFVIVSSVLVCRGGNKPLMDNYEVNGDLLSPTSPAASVPAGGPGVLPSALVGGSFRPPPIAALNDYVYPDPSGGGGGVTSLVGAGGGGGGSKLVLERSHYDKKMAVS